MAESHGNHDSLSPVQRRSSSQTSSSSRKSQRIRPARSRAAKRLSASSTSNAPTDLTSFPSLSPDSSPEGFRGEPALNHALSQALLTEGRANGNTERGRKATLEGLTTSLPQVSGRSALFSDSISSRDVPGTLHLANDEHIERMIARTGAVTLIRQFARDLALRDAEISSLRLRADEREKELKKMLREAEVSNHDIESRLYFLENPGEKPAGGAGLDNTVKSGEARKLSPTIDDMMSQAMVDDIGAQNHDLSLKDRKRSDLQATIRPRGNDSDTKSGESSLRSTRRRKEKSATTRGWQDYIWGSTSVSRKTSRASSVMSDLGEHVEGDDGLRLPSSSTNRRKALDEHLFEPPSANDDDGSITKPASGDNSSTNSRTSSKSLASWTVRLFAGNPQSKSEADGSEVAQSRTSPAAHDQRRRTSSTAESTPKSGGSAVAALKRINGTISGQNASGKSPAPSVRGSTRQVGSRRDGVRSGVPSEHRTSVGTPSNLGPVEMDAILPLDTRPPTLNHIYKDYYPGQLLTDRFGFIYDQRRKKRQREADTMDDHIEVAGNSEDFGSSDNTGNRPLTSETLEDNEHGPTAIRRWQDYLKIATKPTELLSHTPSAGPIVSLAAAGDDKPRCPSIAIDKSGTISVTNPSSHASTSTTPAISNNAEFAGSTNDTAISQPVLSEQEPVKLLLERLTDLHDTLQRERTIKWNEFMRKVRAERRKEGEAAAALPSDRSSMSLATPEASLADGEVVGIAGLGNKGKVGRAKWREFRNLVLGGIPVAYRAKVWSECSGASALRVPGYYDDLVKGVVLPVPDPSVVAQIDMDIHRTLTDNVFFRKGPGVEKLKEVLLAYSRRNPEVGYCQGMNLIAGSLLLIMPTAEDAFWVLASIIENILPPHYYDHGLLASRADQQVLRQYVTEILPKLSAYLDELGIELEALTFQWFLSVFTDCLSAEALYRVWDVVLCLNAPSGSAPTLQPTHNTNQKSSNPGSTSTQSMASLTSDLSNTPSGVDQSMDNDSSSGGGGSTFFFQVALALLKLNEQQLLNTCHTAAAVYTYINHQMTNHAISIDGLIQASEALRNVVKREDVLTRRAAALREIKETTRVTTGTTRQDNKNT